MKNGISWRFGSSAFTFVLMMGIVNLFGDMTYEGGVSINGPFLGTLGAGAAAVSIIAGLGEFLGYSLRYVSGYIADRTGKHWPITFIGYSINLLAVPALALATGWQLAAILVLAERISRAIRKPTVEAILSYSTGKHGKGWVYAVNTAMDETGATVGPLTGPVFARELPDCVWAAPCLLAAGDRLAHCRSGCVSTAIPSGGRRRGDGAGEGVHGRLLALHGCGRMFCGRVDEL
jgi:MFS family permease